MLDRIQELLAARELSASQFADTIGVSRPVVSHLLSGRNKPSLEVVQKVLAAFPDISVNWLLNGDGTMLARPVPVVPLAAATAPMPMRPPAPATSPLAPLPAPPLEAPLEAPMEATRPPEPPQATPATAVAGPVAPPVTAPAPPPVLVAATVPSVAAGTAPRPAPLPAAAMATVLAEPGKTIRRIVIFYHDGTFTDFQPETGA